MNSKHIKFFSHYLCLLMLYNCPFLKAQSSDSTEIYTVSGIGFGFPAGSTADILQSKISTKIGLDISLRKKPFFIYPSVHLLVFKYDQKEADPHYPYYIKNGRSSISTLTFAAGIRKKFKKLAVYGFIGPGGGLIKEPRSEINTADQQVKLKRRNSWTAAFTAGTGVEYRLGQFAFFAEGGYLYHFQKIQDRPNQTLPVYGGIKSDISGVFRK